jgi:rhodanese-related sulfurtransferase/predicted double-glycine peptidase
MRKLATILALVLLPQLLTQALGNDDAPRPSTKASAKELGTVQVENFGSLRYCGVYSVVVSANMHGKELKAADFLNNENVSSKRGSTIEDISRMLNSAGLASDPFLDGSVGWLEYVNEPVILHIRGQLEKSSVNHWVVFGGMQEDRYRIVDAGKGEVELSRAELLAIWDGIGIVVSKNDAAPSRSQLALLFDVNVQLLIAIAVFTVVIAGTDQPNSLKLLLGLLIGCSVFILRDDSLYRNQHAASVARSSTVIQEVSVEQIDVSDIKRSASDFILLDARTEGQFKSRHLPSALSLPVNASILDYIMFSREHVTEDKAVITYCNSEHCKWADKVAKRLLSLGVETKVLRGGIVAWDRK